MPRCSARQSPDPAGSYRRTDKDSRSCSSPCIGRASSNPVLPWLGPRQSGGRLLLLFEDALVQIADDHAGEPLVVDKEALTDRVGVLFGDLNRLLQDLVGGKAAIDEALDIADPIFDDLPLFLQIALGAGVAVPGNDGLDVERFDAFERRKPFPGVALLQP